MNMTATRQRPPRVRRIGISTGGGDAPGLNAVIRAAVRTALNLGWEVMGIRRGFDGLFVPGMAKRLTARDVAGILHMGGTILGTTNRGNPFEYRVKVGKQTVVKDMSGRILHHLRASRTGPERKTSISASKSWASCFIGFGIVSTGWIRPHDLLFARSSLPLPVVFSAPAFVVLYIALSPCTVLSESNSVADPTPQDLRSPFRSPDASAPGPSDAEQVNV